MSDFIEDHRDEIMAVDLRREQLDFSYADDPFVLSLMDLFAAAQKAFSILDSEKTQAGQVARISRQYQEAFHSLLFAADAFLLHAQPEFQRSDDAGTIGTKIAMLAEGRDKLKTAVGRAHDFKRGMKP
jgi:hypothetical protein